MGWVVRLDCESEPLSDVLAGYGDYWMGTVDEVRRYSSHVQDLTIVDFPFPVLC